jgi:hypothetical protein
VDTVGWLMAIGVTEVRTVASPLGSRTYLRLVEPFMPPQQKL